MYTTDNIYIHRLSFRLTKFRQIKENLFNFRCPLCGDSKKDTNKTRAYFYKHNKKPTMCFKCHNCGESMYFSQFLERFDSVLFKEYLYSKFKTKKRTPKKGTIYTNESDKMKQLKEKANDNMFDDLVKISDLDDDHPAKQYLINRNLPEKEFTDLYYADKFRSWTNTIVHNKFENVDKYDEPRIVIPFRRESGTCYAYQGRALNSDNKVKYITIVVYDTGNRTWGMNRVDKEKPIVVVEGPLDAMFLSNCIAAAGSDLRTDVGDIFVLDVENRNPHIVKKMKGLLDKGKTIVMLDPIKYSGMDINDLILSGMTGEEVKQLLMDNTYSGMKGIMKLNQWKRC